MQTNPSPSPAPIVPGSPAQVKPGYKTTEFWLTVTVSIATLLGALAGVVPPQTAAILAAISNGLYAISRGMAKQAVTVAAIGMLFVAGLLASGCANTPAARQARLEKFSAYLHSPYTQMVLHDIEMEALSIGGAMLADSLNGGDFSWKKDVISGGIAGIRSVELTPALDTSAATTTRAAVKAFTADPSVAPGLAKAAGDLVLKYTGNGVPASVAAEMVARGLEQAVAAK